MRSIITSILIIIFTSIPSSSKSIWEIVYYEKLLESKGMAAFPKDTFVTINEYDSYLNGQPVNQELVKLSTDKGNSWNTIYEDTWYLLDNPTYKQKKTFDPVVTENGIIAFTRDSSLFYYSKNYGNTWDSIYVHDTNQGKANLMTLNNKIYMHFQANDTIKVFNPTNEEIELNIPTNNLYVKDYKGNDSELIENGFIPFEDKIIRLVSDRDRYDVWCNILISYDNGKTWDIYEQDYYYQSIMFINENVGYGIGAVYPSDEGDNEDKTGIINKTTDGGKTWFNIFKTESKNMYLHKIFKVGDELLAYSGNRIYASSDEFKTWTLDSLPVDENSKSRVIDAFAVDSTGTALHFRWGGQVLRRVETSTFVESLEEVSKIAKTISVYDLQRRHIKDIPATQDILNVPSGQYLLMYKDQHGNMLKSKKIMLTE